MTEQECFEDLFSSIMLQRKEVRAMEGVLELIFFFFIMFEEGWEKVGKDIFSHW